MSDLKPELKRCSRCHSKLLLQYFSTNRIGELYKLCNNCRVPKDPKEAKQKRLDLMLKRKCTRCHLMQDMIQGFGLNQSGGVYRLCKECRAEEEIRAVEYDRTHKDKWTDNYNNRKFLRELNERLNHPIQIKV